MGLVESKKQEYLEIPFGITNNNKNNMNNKNNKNSINDKNNYENKIILNYYGVLPSDVQKLVTKYFTSTESANKMILAFPEYRERICNSLEILKYDTILDLKNIDKNKKRMLLTKNIMGSDMNLYKNLFENLVYTDVDYLIDINSKEDIEKLYNYRHLKNWKLNINIKINNENNENYEIIELYIMKIVEMYLNFNDKIIISNDICHSSIEIYHSNSYLDYHSPIFMYKNGIFGIFSTLLRKTSFEKSRNFAVWEMMEKRGCKLKGFSINRGLFPNELIYIIKYLKSYIASENNLYIDEDGNNKYIFDTLIVDYDSCHIYKSPIITPIMIMAEILKICPHIKNIKFDGTIYNKHMSKFKKSLYQNEFEKNLDILYYQRFTYNNNINISIVNIFNMNVLSDIYYNYSAVKFLLRIFTNIDKFYFTPHHKNILNISRQNMFQAKKDLTDKLFLDPKVKIGHGHDVFDYLYKNKSGHLNIDSIESSILPMHIPIKSTQNLH